MLLLLRLLELLTILRSSWNIFEGVPTKALFHSRVANLIKLFGLPSRVLGNWRHLCLPFPHTELELVQRVPQVCWNRCLWVLEQGLHHLELRECHASRRQHFGLRFLAGYLLPVKPLEVNLDLLIYLILKTVSEIFVHLTLKLLTVESDPSQVLIVLQVFLNLLDLIRLRVVFEAGGASLLILGEWVHDTWGIRGMFLLRNSKSGNFESNRLISPA